MDNTGKMISCFLAGGDAADLNQTVRELRQSALTGDIFVTNQGRLRRSDLPEVRLLDSGSFLSTEALVEVAGKAASPYILLYTKPQPLLPGPWALERMVQVAGDTGAGLVYSDYYAMKEGKLHPNPVIDYQPGSLRDDFNFGSVLLFDTTAFEEAVSRMANPFRYAALYDLRLKVSQRHPVIRIPEFLYTETETDLRRSGEKQFDYVDPRNRAVQVEMEEACTLHLKAVGGWLKPVFRQVDLVAEGFPCEASVVIPVRNRVRTIEDAVRSALSQKASFSFNLMVVDNHSGDGTTEILEALAAEDDRLVHIVPDRHDLGIGGCWTTAIMDRRCGNLPSSSTAMTSISMTMLFRRWWIAFTGRAAPWWWGLTGWSTSRWKRSPLGSLTIKSGPPTMDPTMRFGSTDWAPHGLFILLSSAKYAFPIPVTAKIMPWGSACRGNTG